MADGESGEEKLVPLKAVDEQRDKRVVAERRVAELEGFERGRAAAQPAAAAEAPKELTAAELQQAVDEQRMTAVEAEGIRERQMERRVETKLTATAEAQAIAARTTDELGRYIETIPGLADTSSAEFEKVKSEFAYLTGHGYDNDKRTELLAVRAAFGDVSKLEKIGQQNARETHQETGGAAAPGPDGAPARTDAWPKDMPAKNRRYYDGQINKGFLPDRRAAVKEWSYKPKHNPRYAA